MASLPVVQYYRCTLDVLPRLGCRRFSGHLNVLLLIRLSFFLLISFNFISIFLFLSIFFLPLLFLSFLRLQSIESTYQVLPFWFYTFFPRPVIYTAFLLLIYNWLPTRTVERGIVKSSSLGSLIDSS